MYSCIACDGSRQTLSFFFLSTPRCTKVSIGFILNAFSSSISRYSARLDQVTVIHTGNICKKNVQSPTYIEKRVERLILVCRVNISIPVGKEYESLAAYYWVKAL